MGGLWQKWQINALEKKITAFKNLRQNNPASEQQKQKEIKCYHDLAKIYAKRQYKSKYPQALLWYKEALRNAAALGDTQALFLLGSLLLDEAKTLTQISRTPLNQPIQTKQAQLLYDEALAYLGIAEQQQDVASQRLLGLIWINGWGVNKDIDKGFEKIVNSIDAENAWGRATEIFKSLGLNKPEFFSYMMSSKQRSTAANNKDFNP